LALEPGKKNLNARDNGKIRLSDASNREEDRRGEKKRLGPKGGRKEGGEIGSQGRSDLFF